MDEAVEALALGRRVVAPTDIPPRLTDSSQADLEDALTTLAWLGRALGEEGAAELRRLAAIDARCADLVERHGNEPLEELVAEDLLAGVPESIPLAPHPRWFEIPSSTLRGIPLADFLDLHSPPRALSSAGAWTPPAWLAPAQGSWPPERWNERYERVLRRRLVDGWTLQRIGDEFGVTRARIQQVEKKAMARVSDWCDAVLAPVRRHLLERSGEPCCLTIRKRSDSWVVDDCVSLEGPEWLMSLALECLGMGRETQRSSTLIRWLHPSLEREVGQWLSSHAEPEGWVHETEVARAAEAWGVPRELLHERMAPNFTWWSEERVWLANPAGRRSRLRYLLQDRPEGLPAADLERRLGISHRLLLSSLTRDARLVYDRTSKRVSFRETGGRPVPTIEEVALGILERHPRGLSCRALHEEVLRVRPASRTTVDAMRFHRDVGRTPEGRLALLRFGAEPWPEPMPREQPKGCCWIDRNTLEVAIPVNPSLLRGNSVPIHRYVGIHAGLTRAPSERSFLLPDGRKLRLARSLLQHYVSTLRAHAKELGAGEGDVLLLTLHLDDDRAELAKARS